MGFAAVARVTDTRWITCSVKDEVGFGLIPGSELKLETTICHEIRQSGEGVVIDNVAEDPVYARHHTPAMYGLQSYISMPIVLPDGRFFGTLCAIDAKPHHVSRPEIVGMFKMFAELIAFHLDAHERMASQNTLLAEAEQTAQLRDQFIAVLGHDLRNPLSAITSGAFVLKRTPLNDKASMVVAMIEKSAFRMSELITNVLDFARGRLGAGLTLTPTAAPLEPVLDQVAAELRATWPDREVAVDYALTETVICDHNRMAQLFSNLLGNAMTHGAPDQPIRVTATSGEGLFTLSVYNGGAEIPLAAMQRLFQPFSRGEVIPDQQGLGLGLYIASEIAKAHGGRLTATSTPDETCFTLIMPTGRE